MKTILYIAPHKNVMGGISTVIKNYMDAGLKDHHRIILVASHVDGPKCKKLLRALWAAGAVLIHILFCHIDIVHIHCGDIVSVKRKFFFLKLTKYLGKKVILHFHGASFMDQYADVSEWWKRRLVDFFKLPDVIICLSESWRRTILEIVPEARVIVVANAVQIPEMSPPIKTNKTVRLAFLGLIGERKGLFDLLEVSQRLLKKGYRLDLEIGGNGDLNRLNREVSERGLTKHVHYLGWISPGERDRLLRRTDIYVLPSYGEGMPMSVLEAMSYGIPIVSTTVGGIPEMIVDGETGFLVAPGNLDALTERLETLIADDALRSKMGTNARHRVIQRHNIMTNIKVIADLYQNL